MNVAIAIIKIWSFRAEFVTQAKAVCLSLIQRPLAGLRDRCCGVRSLAALISEIHLDEGIASECSLVEHQHDPIAVLPVRRVDHDPENIAERIQEQVLLDAPSLLVVSKIVRTTYKPRFLRPSPLPDLILSRFQRSSPAGFLGSELVVQRHSQACTLSCSTANSLSISAIICSPTAKPTPQPPAPRVLGEPLCQACRRLVGISPLWK